MFTEGSFENVVIEYLAGQVIEITWLWWPGVRWFCQTV